MWKYSASCSFLCLLLIFLKSYCPFQLLRHKTEAKLGWKIRLNEVLHKNIPKCRLYCTFARNAALRLQLQMDAVLINVAFPIFQCDRLRENQMLISRRFSRKLAGSKCCCPPSECCSNVPLVYYVFFSSSLANVFISIFGKCRPIAISHISATAERADQREFTAVSTCCQASFSPFVCLCFLAELRSAEGRRQWHFLQHLKGKVVTISNQPAAYLNANEGCARVWCWFTKVWYLPGMITCRCTFSHLINSSARLSTL